MYFRKDVVDCGSGFVGDTKIDYYYSNIGSGVFFLPLQKVGEEIKVTLPDLVGYGKHKVTWRVKRCMWQSYQLYY